MGSEAERISVRSSGVAERWHRPRLCNALSRSFPLALATRRGCPWELCIAPPAYSLLLREKVRLGRGELSEALRALVSTHRYKGGERAVGGEVGCSVLGEVVQSCVNHRNIITYIIIALSFYHYIATNTTTKPVNKTVTSHRHHAAPSHHRHHRHHIAITKTR